MSSTRGADDRRTSVGRGSTRGVRGIIIVLLGRLGLPVDIARYIYAWRRADYDATYWRLMGHHYTIAARHRLVVRRPLLLGGARGYRYLTEVYKRGQPQPWETMTFETADVGGVPARQSLNIIVAMLNAHHDYVIIKALESRAKCIKQCDDYVTGAVSFAECVLWLAYDLLLTEGRADCYNVIYAEETGGVINLQYECAFAVWAILAPGADILDAFYGDGDPDLSGACARRIASIIAASDYSGW